MRNSIDILCTRPIDEMLIRQAKEKGIDVDTLSFIETEPIENVEVQQEIEAVFILNATVVFTSMNAVEAVAEHLSEDDRPIWSIYCIGQTTQQLVQKYFIASQIAGTADSASALADIIVKESDTDEVIFFCGDQRRDDLPKILRNQGILVTEIVVYQTITVPHKLSKNYRGILFFSPSAVESFFKNNLVQQDTILFAIGITTATTIKKFTKNKVLIAEQPGKEFLFEKMVEYFGG